MVVVDVTSIKVHYQMAKCSWLKQYRASYCCKNPIIFCLGLHLTSVSFLAFGVGLDPRQGLLFGPKLGPFLTACVLGLMTFATVGLAPGYPGASMNPVRCFAFAVARGDFQRKFDTSQAFRHVKISWKVTRENRSVDMVGWASCWKSSTDRCVSLRPALSSWKTTWNEATKGPTPFRAC